MDETKFDNITMQKLKRKAGKKGRVAGHFAGVGKPLLNITEARKQIYLPAYLVQLRACTKEIKALRKMAQEHPLCLKDFNTNADLTLDKPLSHATLIKRFLETGALDLTPTEHATHAVTPSKPRKPAKPRTSSAASAASAARPLKKEKKTTKD
jgi:hypothetical protein